MSQPTKEERVDFELRKPVRPMVIVTDEKGDRWWCDKGADPEKDLASQGCWNCGEMAFNRND